jgi:hypothetical protein
MSESTGRAGLGVVLEIGDGAPIEQFQTLTSIASMQVLGRSINMLDATTLSSPDAYAEFKPGLKTSAAWRVVAQWDPTNGAGAHRLRSKAGVRVPAHYRLNMAGAGLGFGALVSAYVTDAGPIESAPDGLITQAFEITPLGKVEEIDVTPQLDFSNPDTSLFLLAF